MSRSCGKCQACCVTVGVKEIAKPPGQRCASQCAKGCAIYAERPAGCRDYACLWLSGYGAESDRPDRLGLIFDRSQHAVETRGEKAITAREVRPGARHERRPVLQLAALHADGWDLRVARFGSPVLDTLEACGVRRRA